MDPDDEYSATLVKEIYEAIVRTSRLPDGTSVVKSGPAFDALIVVTAMMVSRSPGFDRSAVVKAFAEGAAKKLRREIAAVRANPELAEAFGTAIDPTALH